MRLPRDLKNLQGFILPGGESTTIGKLAVTYGFLKPLQDFAQQHPLWGTWAGAIFMSQDSQRQQPLLGLMNIAVQRNAFGRQVASFEADLDVPALAQNENDPAEPFHALFIRAPLIEKLGLQSRF